MNYSGKFDGKFPVEGSGLQASAHGHVETFSPHATHAPADAIVIPDAHLLFNGDFKRAGVDLVISNDDQELVLHDYFKGEKRVALASPDGAHLTGDIVNALTGHVEYAQADGSASVSKIIGHVTKLAGTATAVRNGVSIILNQGDNVEKGDVVQSGSGSTLGITFIDGTVFGLSSNARMVLNEMIYDPNGSNNSSLLSLVAGTITFVAGETAKHGDMKIDTPVATMGIRGTAVLVEIDFDVSGQGGLPDTKFQVLVEPDGTTGSYILFDKTTLTPIAIVDKAGQQINISNGTLSQSTTGLSPEIQKLITDVFSIKYTDNTNTKSFDHHTDTPIPDMLPPFKMGFITATPVILLVNAPAIAPPQASTALSSATAHINQAPSAVVLDSSNQPHTNFNLTERPGVTHSTALDTVSGKVNFVDINAGDNPTVSTSFESFTYHNAAGTDVTATLNALQLADIKAVEAQLSLVADPGNMNTGSDTWTYSVADGAFDFLAAGETLTLTYEALVNNNYAPNDAVTPVYFTITITGTNDVPVITSPQQNIAFVSAGTDTKGGELIPNTATIGKLTFTDPDLTDTHTVAVTMTSALLDGQSFAATVGPVVINELAAALTAKITAADDSTGTGTGTVEWALANLQVYLADLVPNGESLVLTYAVTVTDSQNATSTQDIVVTISGNNTAAVVWTDTNPIPWGGALWSVASNWEGDRTPGSSDDVIIGTDQVLPATPTFPVTVNANAAAKSLTMDYFSDFGTAIPELDVESNVTLTIAGALNVDTSTDPLSPLTAESIIKNYGNISVGGIATLLKHSVLDNYGTFLLEQGGDFLDQSSITNSGTIEIAGGTLDVEVAIANSGGTIQVDHGTTLKLNGAAINGGIITDNGTIDVTANSSINGIVAGPVITNALLNNGGVTIESGVTLTLDNVTVTGTTFTDTAAGATIQVDAGASLTLDGTTITGGTVTDTGTVNVDSGDTLKLSGVALSGGSITNAGTIEISGTGSIDNDSFGNNQLTVDSGVILTLDGTTITGGTITDTGTVNVDATKTLKLSGVALSGGSITNAGTIEISGTGSIDNDSFGNNQLTVDGGVILTLDGTTITGGTVTDTGTVNVDATKTLKLSGVALSGGSITNAGTVEISGTGSIDIDSFGNHQLTVDGGVILTLDGTTVTGGTITDTGTVNVDATKTLKLSGVALSGGSITNAGTIEISGTGSIDTDSFGNNQLTVDSGVILTLDGTTVTGGTITDTGTVNVDATKTLKLSGVALSGGSITNAGTIEISGTGSIDTDSFGNNQLTVDSGVILTLDGTTITGGTVTDTGTVNVDSGDTLKLSGVALSGGSITNAGTIEISGTGSIDTDSFGNNQLTVDSGVILTLDGTTVTGGTITDTGTVNVDSGDTLKLSGVALSGGSITNAGTVEISGTGSIDTDSFGNHQLTVDSGVILTLDGTTITGGTVTDTGTVNVDATKTLKLSGVALSGGSITNAGTIEISGTGSIDIDSFGNHQLTVDGGVILTLDGTTITGGTVTDTGTVNVEAAKTLKLSGVALSGGSITNAGTVEISGTGSIDNDSFGNNQLTVDSGVILTLDGTTVTGGTVTDTGTVNVDATKTLKLSGVALSGGSITNAGTIEISGTGSIDTDSFGNNQLTVDSGVILTLDGTTITGGTITDTGTVNVDATKTLKLSGVALSGGSITNAGTIEISGTGSIDTDSFGNNQLTVDGGVILTLDGTTVTGGTITDTGTVNVDATKTLKLSGVALSGGSITNAGTIEISGTGSIDTDSFGNNQLTVDSGVILTLDGTTVTGGTITDTGTVNVDSGDTLKLSGVALSGGSITNAGTVEISGTGSIDTDSFGNHQLTVDSGVILTLDGTTVTGGTITDTGTVNVDATKTLKLSGVALSGGSITNAGTIEITGTGSIDNDSFGNNQLTVDSGVILTLDGTTVTGGTVTNNGTVNVDSGDTLTLGAGAAFDGGTITNDGTLDIEASSGATLSGVNITGTGNMEIDSQVVTSSLLMAGGATMTDGTLTVGSVGTLDIGSALGATLNDVSVINHNAIEVLAGSILTLDLGTTVANAGATITVDGQAHSHATLALNDATIDGGTINDYSYIPDADDINGVGDADDFHAGLIDVTGSSKIDSNAVLNKGDLTVESGATLTLDNVTVNGTAITVIANGAIETDSGTTQISGGSIVNDGTLEVAGAGSTLVIDDNVSGTGSLNISGGATLDLVGQDNGEGVTFLPSSTGTLEIDTTIAPHGTLTFGGEISGVTASDTIDLADLQYTSGASHGDIAVGAVAFDGTTLVTVTNTNTHQSVVLDVAGSHTIWTVTSDGHGGVDIVDPPADSSSLTISSGALLDIGTASAASVSFLNDSGTTGTLALDTSSSFTGVISGFTGNGTPAGSDQIDLKDINFGSSSFSESYNPTNDTLSVSDGANSAVLHFTGVYQAANFSFESDGNGGTVVYDPPVPGNEPASSTIVASAPNQTLTGNAASDTFLFNFSGVGQATVTDFHPTTDTLEFSSQLFANLQAALNATHDDGHGNTVIALDAHDTITLNGIIKAQLQASDFHFV